ncbi:hypothetical protein ACYCSU_17290 [Paenibacillus sp. ALE1]
MIIEDLKKTTMGLQEVVDSLNAEMEEDFDDCYELGYSHGKKVGRLAAYKEILKMYEQHQQEEAQQKWEEWSKNKKDLDKEIEALMESTQQVLRRKID